MSLVRSDGYELLLDGPRADFGEHHVARQSPTVSTGQPAVATPASNKLPAEDTVVNLTPGSAGQAPMLKLGPAMGAGQHTNVEDVPSADAAWGEAQGVLRTWLAMAVGTIILCVLDAVTGAIAGLGGVIGAIVSLHQCFQGQDLASSIKVTYTCSLLATGLAIGASVLRLSCARKLSAVSLIQGMWLALYGIMSGIIYKRAKHAWKLLNPVSSGVVEV
ncbi:hypothetical protein N2152v2_009913 [Parachlorella kessleri]